MSDDGQYGFSIIALIGSVFSPYYAWSGRTDPQNHVAVNVALYGKGVNRWTMTERGRGSLEQSKHHLTIGPSHLSWEGGKLVIEISETGAPLPKPVCGRIVLTPTGLTEDVYQLDLNGQHFWCPIAPSARVDVTFQKPNMTWSGNAYLDANWGAEPLEDGFEHWDWSRAALSDGAGIFYDAVTKGGENRRLALRFDKAGNTEMVGCPKRVSLSSGPIWRVPRTTPVAINGQARTLSMLEDTPFYTRSRIETRFDGEQVTAIHESLNLDRFSKNWVRCLLPFRMPRMRR